jgi:NADH:ubiquinone oxidoreductase subunit 5 (subunit L)/multisubunit Na+/H+ antiporter MnhA subunit
VASFNPIIALISVGLAVLGIAIAVAYRQGRLGMLNGLTSRNRLAAAGYKLLDNKLYLDVLYTDKIVGAVKGPIARVSTEFNNKGIDAVVNGAGRGAVAVGDSIYEHVDQGLVDTVVNATGTASDDSGQFLRRIQTGRVQQYAALLFGGAVALGIIFVIVTSLLNA